jgi:hypothetical protein
MAARSYTHKRSWKNLLINRGYQLRFTLFMVGVSAVLMAALGYQVLNVAQRTTQVAIAQVHSIDCERLHAPPAPPAPAEAAPEPEPAPAAAPAEPRRRNIQVKSEMQIVEPTTPPPGGTPTPSVAERLEAKGRCMAVQKERLQNLTNRERDIRYALLIVGAVILIGLFVYGIKMTHRVAGPLYKIGQYLADLRDGRYGPVYNLRKGDHLVEFFEHFKQAHQRLLVMQKEDITELKAMIAAFEAAGLSGRNAEVDAALAELKILVNDKEKSIATQA